MALGFGQFADAVDEGEGLGEIAKSELAFDAAGAVCQLPARRLFEISGGGAALKRWYAALAGNTNYFVKSSLMALPVLCLEWFQS